MLMLDWLVHLLIDVFIGLICKFSHTDIPLGLLYGTVCNSESSLHTSLSSCVLDTGLHKGDLQHTALRKNIWATWHRQLFSVLVSNSMARSGTARLLCNPNVYYSVRKSPPLGLSYARWTQYISPHPISVLSFHVRPGSRNVLFSFRFLYYH
jgi:hypothetical protein